MTDTDLASGARNLLANCLGARPGERLLVLAEPQPAGYCDRAAPEAVAREAVAMGLAAELREVPFVADAADAPPEIWAAMRAADCTAFFARLGDQIRFDPLPAGARVAVVYAMDAGMLGSAFGRTDHAAMCALKALFDGAVKRAGEIRLTCPLGTELMGRWCGAAAEEDAEVAIRRFPMGIFKPVPAAGFSGRVAIARFLTGTGHRYYQPYDLMLGAPVLAHVDGGRVTGYEGPEAARAEAHAARVGAMFGIDPAVVHSWHTGIHPGCAYVADALANLARWGNAAFPNPRLLHFHTCGAFAPGEISWNIVDPTIVLDGVPVWQRGVLHPERIAGGAELLARRPELAALFANPRREIGL